MMTSPDLTRHFLSPRKESLPTLRLAFILEGRSEKGHGQRQANESILYAICSRLQKKCTRTKHEHGILAGGGIWGMQTNAKLQLAQGEQAHVEDRTKDMYIHMYIYIYI